MKKYVLGGATVITSLFVNMANAALDPAIATQATTTGADAAALGGLVLVVVVGISMFKHIRAAK